MSSVSGASYSEKFGDFSLHCGICLEPFELEGSKRPALADCIHTFCLDCIRNMIHNHHTRCPMGCGVKLPTEPKINREVINAIEILQQAQLAIQAQIEENAVLQREINELRTRMMDGFLPATPLTTPPIRKVPTSHTVSSNALKAILCKKT